MLELVLVCQVVQSLFCLCAFCFCKHVINILWFHIFKCNGVNNHFRTGTSIGYSDSIKTTCMCDCIGLLLCCAEKQTCWLSPPPPPPPTHTHTQTEETELLLVLQFSLFSCRQSVLSRKIFLLWDPVCRLKPKWSNVLRQDEIFAMDTRIFVPGLRLQVYHHVECWHHSFWAKQKVFH